MHFSPAEQAARATPDAETTLPRKLTLLPAVCLNMVDMIGVGPFATLPFMIAAMGGAMAVYGWVAGAVLAMSDGLIWAELGAAFPKAGGTYAYVSEIYGKHKLGRLLSFLFVFQLIFTAPVSMATGCVGLAGYASYTFPALKHVFFSRAVTLHLLGAMTLKVEVSGATLAAMATALLATLLVAQGVERIAVIARSLWVGVLATLGFVIVTGMTHFHRAMAFPAGWSHTTPPHGFMAAFAGALLIALYDYWGYYNICFIGEEVVKPEKTIPRSMLLSICAVAVLYLLMNVSILGLVPLPEILGMTKETAGNYPAARAAQLAWGPWAGHVVAMAVVWTAFASVFALLVGYSRIPFAAARDNNFFRVFKRLDALQRYPVVSIVFMGLMAAALCVFQLGSLVSALVIVRILMVFAVQAVGVVYWRISQPEAKRPFRMWLFPLPVVLTLGGFALILTDPVRQALVGRGLLLGGLGVVLFLWRSHRRREWPFALRAAVDVGDGTDGM